MKIHQPMFFVMICLLAAGCGNKATTTTSTATASGGSNTTAEEKATAAANISPLDAPGSYGNALVNGRNKAIKVVDIASINQAIQLFNEQEGRFPKDLNELVTSKFLGEIPKPPYQMEFQYDPVEGKVSVVLAK